MNNFEDLKDELLVAISELFTSDFFEQLSKTQVGEVSVLLFIYRYGGPTIPSLISDCLSISRARVTAIITTLNEKGLVRFERNKVDRRKLMVSITELGVQTIKQKLDSLDTKLLAMLKKLGLEKSQALVDTIFEIISIIEVERKLKND